MQLSAVSRQPGFGVAGWNKRATWSAAARRGAAYSGVAGVAGCTGLAVSTNLKLAAAIAAALSLCFYVAYATGHPRGAAFLMFASLMLIPVYAVPTYRSFSPEPTAVAALILAVVLFRPGTPLKLSVVDLAFAATCGGMLVAAMLGPATLQYTFGMLFEWVPPYLAGRAICKRRDGARTFALFGAVAGLVVVPFIAYEKITGSNVFLRLAIPNTTLTKLWGKPIYRPGTNILRTDAAFGHPLTMALVISTCAVFAVALAIHTKSRPQRLAWLAGAASLIAAQYTSDERSGWIVLFVGLFLLAATAIPHDRRIRYVSAFAIVGIPVALFAISHFHPTNVATQATLSDSSAYRTALYNHALHLNAFSLVGFAESANFNIFVNAVKSGGTSIDAAYLQIGDTFGWIALIPLLAVVAAVGWVAVALRGTWEAAIPAVAMAVLVGIAVIGFQTQVPIFTWLVVGAVAGVAVGKRSPPEQPTAT